MILLFENFKLKTMKKNLLLILAMLCLYLNMNAQILGGNGDKAYLLNATQQTSPLNFGIGTKQPTQKLHIVGDENGTGRYFIRLENNNTGPTSTAIFDIYSGADKSKFGSIAFTGAEYSWPEGRFAHTLNIHSNGNLINLEMSNTNGGISFCVGRDANNYPIEKVRFNKTGVGIGTSSPSAKLHTIGTVKLEQLNTGSSFILTNDAEGNVLKSSTSLTDLNATITSLVNRLTIAEAEIEILKKKVGVNAPIIHQKTALFQNEPNPATEITKIKFYLAELSRKVNIFITDINGRMVQQFELNDVSDNQEIVVNANELQAGMYFYTLFVNGKETDTKKMFITK